jgi:hypothetical protein
VLKKLLILAGIVALAGACGKTPEPGSSAAASATASAGASAGATTIPQSKIGPGEIAWDVPKKWTQAPNPNAMRLATYLIPRADGDSDDAEMSVSRVGGSVEMNLNRWKAQFDPPKADSTKRMERTVAGLRVTIFEVAGNYTGMVMKGQVTKPKESYALVAAIVEGSGGDPWFFKLTGPEKTVAAARADFDSLANSFRPK